MSKLYEKKEMTFAILCIVVYVVVLGTVRGNYGDGSIYSLITLSIFTVITLFFLWKNKLWEKYGLTSWPSGRKYWYFIPFILMVAVNLWSGIAMEYQGMAQVFAVCSMTLVGFLEEMIFRGFLFKAMEKENVTRAIVVSSVTFGAGHIINILTGHATMSTVLQVCYAIAIGFAFVMVFYKSKSLWPCILTHSLVNVASRFRNDAIPESMKDIRSISEAIFLLVVGGVYAYYVYRKVDAE